MEIEITSDRIEDNGSQRIHQVRLVAAGIHEATVEIDLDGDIGDQLEAEATRVWQSWARADLQASPLRIIGAIGEGVQEGDLRRWIQDEREPSL